MQTEFPNGDDGMEFFLRGTPVALIIPDYQEELETLGSR
jgi:hypothetical protein